MEKPVWHVPERIVIGASVIETRNGMESCLYGPANSRKVSMDPIMNIAVPMKKATQFPGWLAVLRCR
jgi:hypothetical protein